MWPSSPSRCRTQWRVRAGLLRGPGPRMPRPRWRRGPGWGGLHHAGRARPLHSEQPSHCTLNSPATALWTPCAANPGVAEAARRRTAPAGAPPGPVSRRPPPARRHTTATPARQRCPPGLAPPRPTADSLLTSCLCRRPPAEIDAADEQIPLPNVSGKILAKVVEYCKYHVDAEKKDEQGEGRSVALYCFLSCGP